MIRAIAALTALAAGMAFAPRPGAAHPHAC
jgi:hypothetical protein